MANFGSKDLLVLLYGGYDLRPDINTIPTWTHDAVIEDVTPFGVVDQVQLFTGLRKASFEIKGFYNDAALASNAALLGELTATAPLCVGPAGNAVGQPFFGCLSVESSYQRGSKVGGVTFVDAKLNPTGEIDEGDIQQPLGTVTVNGNSTNIDSGVVSTAFGMVAYLQVPAFTKGSATSFTVTIQDSADGTTFANVAGGAFTALTTSITTVPFAQRLVIAGTIRRYTRAIWAWAGTPTGSSATFFVGIYRGLTQAVSLVEPTRKDKRTALDEELSFSTEDSSSEEQNSSTEERTTAHKAGKTAEEKQS